MKQKNLFALWGGLFILCAGLGFIPQRSGALRYLLTAASLAFFVPPALLLRTKDENARMLVRNLSALSLGLTLVTLVLNFLLAFQSEWLGNVMHFILVVVSAPMIAMGSWVVSLFFWACLLLTAIRRK